MREMNRLRRDWNLERAHRLQLSSKACVHGRNVYESVILTVRQVGNAFKQMIPCQAGNAFKLMVSGQRI